MDSGSARRNLRILEREPAEGDHQPGVLDDGWPVRDIADHRLKGADDARQDVLRRAEAVVGDLIHATTAKEEESPHQGARMMHPTRRRPAIGAAQNRSMTEG